MRYGCLRERQRRDQISGFLLFFSRCQICAAAKQCHRVLGSLGTSAECATPLEPVVLSKEAEFTLGALRICPAKREVIAREGRELLQPRIMQVLVALARRRGEVVSRDDLIAACWGGFAVSDDAIHRCIARIRRLAEAHGGFRLETVPRVGYQLSESVVMAPPGKSGDFWTKLRVPAVTLLIAAVVLIVAGALRLL